MTVPHCLVQQPTQFEFSPSQTRRSQLTATASATSTTTHAFLFPRRGAQGALNMYFRSPPSPPAGSMLALVPGMVELLLFKEWSRGQNGSEFLSNGEGSR